MVIEEAIEILKDNIKSLEGHTPFKHTNYEKVQAIETLLTAYEKEKEKNKELSNSYDELVKNNTYMVQLGDITIKYIGSKEDTARGKREIFEIERLCK